MLKKAHPAVHVLPRSPRRLDFYGTCIGPRVINMLPLCGVEPLFNNGKIKAERCDWKECHTAQGQRYGALSPPKTALNFLRGQSFNVQRECPWLPSSESPLGSALHPVMTRRLHPVAAGVHQARAAQMEVVVGEAMEVLAHLN